jgi:hypothetical protein
MLQMEPILSCYSALERLELDGEITIIEIKNRIRDGATATGYVDMNIRIDFRGHICEMQILDQVMFGLKNEMHSSFELCRSFNLVGPLPPVAPRRASAVVRSVPLTLRLALGVLRFLVGVFALAMSSWYLVFLFYPGLTYFFPEEPLLFKLIFGFALSAPFSITCFLACSDLLGGAVRGLSHVCLCAVLCGIVLVGCGIILSFGAATGNPGTFMLFCFMAIAYLLHFAAAATAVRCRGCCSSSGRRRGGSPSRAAMLYRRYLGINGTLFVWKVVALQLVTIMLQAMTKLEILGMAVAMEGASYAYLGAYAVLFKPLYWAFVCALVLNAIYPAVLLRSKRFRLQRDAVAATDLLLDMIYFLAFFLSMYAAGGAAQIVPTTPILYASMLWPLVHVVTTARAIETAAVQRQSPADRASQIDPQEQAARRQRLPRWAAAAFLLLAGSGCSLPFLMGARAYYPFNNGDTCRPCACSREAVLGSCEIPATLGAPWLFLDGKGIRGIAPGAFRKLSTLRVLDLSHNNISALPVGAFDGLDRLTSLDLSANDVDVLRAGDFDGVPLLMTLVLRDNPLAALRAGAFAGLDQLHNLFLDGLGELHVVEPSVFADTPRVANVWVGSSALNCTRLGLPSGVTCFDDMSCDVEHVALIGKGFCHGGEYDTAACASDGGACA